MEEGKLALVAYFRLACFSMTFSAIFSAISFVRYLAVSSSVFGLWNVICKTRPCFKFTPPLCWTGKFYEGDGPNMFAIVGQVSPRSRIFCGAGKKIWRVKAFG